MHGSDYFFINSHRLQDLENEKKGQSDVCVEKKKTYMSSKPADSMDSSNF